MVRLKSPWLRADARAAPAQGGGVHSVRLTALQRYSLEVPAGFGGGGVPQERASRRRRGEGVHSDRLTALQRYSPEVPSGETIGDTNRA